MYNSRFCRRLSSQSSHSSQTPSALAMSRGIADGNCIRTPNGYGVTGMLSSIISDPKYIPCTKKVSLWALHTSCQYQFQDTHRTVPLSIRILVPTTRRWQQPGTKDSQTPTYGRELVSDSRQSVKAPRNILDPVALLSTHNHRSTYGNLTPLGLPREVTT